MDICYILCETGTVNYQKNAKVADTGMGVLYQLLRSFHYRDKKVFVSLYKTYMRPHLEFASPVWNPWLRKDVIALEKVQKKFVRNITCLNGTYIDKLANIGLLTLENRRKYLDLVETFKIVHGHSRVDYREFFTLVGDNPRRNTRSADCPINIIVQRCNLDIR